MNKLTASIRRSAPWLLLVPIFLLAVGCSGSSSDKCKADTDCPAPQICVEGECVGDQGCTSFLDCTSGEICYNGQCIPEQTDCQNDGDCAANEHCVVGVCRPLSACLNDGDCSANEQCVNGVCQAITGCQDDGDCAANEWCVNGDCEPRSGCRDNTDCTFPETCVAGACVDDTDPPSDLVLITVIDDPADQGFARMEFDLDDSIDPTYGELLLDGEVVAELKDVDQFSLDTIDFPDGQRRISLRVFDEAGQAHVGWTLFEIRNPTVRLARIDAPKYVYPGLEMEILLTTVGSVQAIEVDLSGLDPAFNPAAVQVVLGDPNRITYTLSASLTDIQAPVQIPIQLIGTDGRTFAYEDYWVKPGGGPLLPLRSEKGLVDWRDFPQADQAGALIDVLNLTVDGSVETGGKMRILVELDGDLTGGEVLLAMGGYGGHLAIPISALTPVDGGRESGIFEIPGHITGDEAGTKDVEAGAKDANGKTGGTAVDNTELIQGRQNVLRVTLTWDKGIDADMDLHVTEPGGEEIYWDHRQSSNNGFLDIDSNTDCNIDGKNREVILWTTPPPKPADGANKKFVVKVDYYMSCDTNQDFEYTVQIEGCNADNKYVTVLMSSVEPDLGGAGSGDLVAEFECPDHYVVEGTVQHEYLNRTAPGKVTETGPVVGAEVGVFDLEAGSDDPIGNWGPLDEDGKFKVFFPVNPLGENRSVLLKVRAYGEHAQVLNPDNGEAVHTYEEVDPWTPEEDPAHEAELTIPLDEAGSFHIYTQIDKGMKYFKTKYPDLSAELTRTKVRWPESDSAYYWNEQHINLTKSVNDSDEFDDSVILHELGHRVIKVLSRLDENTMRDGDGSHSRKKQLYPEFAWSEGAATFLGQLVVDHRKYCDRKKSGSGCYIINRMNKLKSLSRIGTSDRGLGSDSMHSEWLVAGLLWDIVDPEDAGEGDFLAVAPETILEHLFTSMTHDHRILKGKEDSADLMDLVHIWGCSADDLDRNGLFHLMDTKYYMQWMAHSDMCPQINDPQVTSVTAAGAKLNTPSVFTVSGLNLLDVWFEFEACDDAGVTQVSATAETVEFRCTPAASGDVPGRIFYKNDDYCTAIDDFTITVAN